MLVLIWGTYGGIREQNMVGPCYGGDFKPTAILNMVIEKNCTAISMEFYKTRLVEVRESGYAILSDFADPSEPEIFRDVNLSFDTANDAELGVGGWVEHKWPSVKLSGQRLKRKRLWK